MSGVGLVYVGVILFVGALQAVVFAVTGLLALTFSGALAPALKKTEEVAV